MVGRFAELWLVQGYRAYDFDHAVEQLTRIWANALRLEDEARLSPPPTAASHPDGQTVT